MEARCLLRLNHHDYAVSRITHVCPLGLEFGLPVRLNTDTTTTLVFTHRSEDDISIKARVTHCTPCAVSWAIRVRFYPHDRDTNMLFYMAIRKYIDAFDHQSADVS